MASEISLERQMSLKAILLSLLLSGCATLDYRWEQTRPPSMKPWLYVYALDADLACRGLGAQAAATARINGCAVWKPVNCIIVLPENPPQWLIEHEQRHCEGWTHP